MKNMKKIISALFAAFLFVSCNFGSDDNISLISKIIAAQNTAGSNKTEVELCFGYGTGSSRTITSFEDWDVAPKEGEADWSVTFYNEYASYGDSAKVSSNVGEYKYIIPKDRYTVEVSRSFTSDGKEHTLYGKKTVDLSEVAGSSVKLEMIVSLKKTENGKGTFGELLIEYDYLNFTPASVYLEEVSGVKSAEEKNHIDLEFEAYPADPIMTISEKTEIPSGYYYLMVCDAENNVLSLKDMLVEIADDEVTSYGAQMASKTPDIAKVFFVTEKASSTNGHFSSYPANINSVLEQFYEASWKEITLNTTENIAFDLKYMPDENHGDKKISVNITNSDFYSCYSLSNALGIYTSDSTSNNSFCINLKSSGEFRKITCSTAVKIRNLILNNACIYFSADAETLSDACVEISGDALGKGQKPFAYFNQANPNINKINFKISGDYASNNCVVPALETEEGSTYKKLYIKPGVSGTLSLGNKIPDFNILVSGGDPGFFDTKQMLVDKDLTFYVLYGDDEPYEIPGVTYKWYLNGNLITGENTDTSRISINLLEQASYLNIDGENILACYAEYTNGTDKRYNNKVKKFTLTTNYDLAFVSVNQDGSSFTEYLTFTKNNDLASLNYGTNGIKFQNRFTTGTGTSYSFTGVKSAFGNNRDVYYLNGGNAIRKYSYASASFNTEEYYTDFDITTYDENNAVLAFDKVANDNKGLAYVITKQSSPDYSYVLYIVTKEGGNTIALGEPIELEIPATANSFLTGFAVHNGKMFVCNNDVSTGAQNTFYESKFYEFDVDVEVIPSCIIKNEVTKKQGPVNVYELVGLPSDYKSEVLFTITDFYIPDENSVYFLVYEGMPLDANGLFYSGGKTLSTLLVDGYSFFHTRGAIAKLTKNDDIYCLDSSFETNGMYGWASDVMETIQIDDDGMSYFVEVIRPDLSTGKGFTGFFGPIKIVAIKEDELVIQDCGSYLEGTKTAKSKNGFVTFNLKSKEAYYTAASETGKLYTNSSSTDWN